MRLEHPAQTLSEALGAALHRDLSKIKYKKWSPSMKKAGISLDDPEALEEAEREPHYNDVDVVLFSETWSSTALGYGGMGGAAITPAYTVIVICRPTQEACVYWGGSRLGKKLNLQKIEDVRMLKKAMEESSTYEISKMD